MYREYIESRMADNKWIKPHPPASVQQISAAEAAMGVKFPKELIDLLSEMNGDGYFLLTAEHIVEYNNMNRNILGEVYDGLDKLLYIAENGCGDYYCYVIENGGIASTQIVCWEHETNETYPVADNLMQLIVRYYNSEIS